MFSAAKTAATSSGGYNLNRSLRFRGSASAYLNRTFGTGSTTQWTWSAWIKRGTLGTNAYIFAPNNVSGEGIYFNSSNQFSIAINGAILLASNAVYRDPSAWYHIIVVSDMGNATASLRCRVYINGVEITSWATDARASYTSWGSINSAINHNIGVSNANSIYFDGYITENNFVNAQVLTPSSFGAYSTTTGVWQPIKYAGTYGTNGFYLNFNNNASTTTLGYDTSGNSNNWTTNNISLTAGVTYDSMTDVPTLTSATAANTAVFNSIGLGSGGTWTISNANLSASNSGSSSYSIAQSTIAASGSKYYFEFTATNVGGGGNLDIGVMQGGYALGGSAPATSSIGQFANGYCYTSNGTVSNNNTNGSTYSSFAANDVIMVALDLVNNKVYFGKNGTWQNSGNPVAGTGYIYSVTAGDYFAAIGRASVSSQTGAATANFGQQPFSYTPPTGFVALNTYNLPTPSISNGANYFAATTYTGNNTSPTSITNGGNNTIGKTFYPDLVWIKDRTSAYNHVLQDSVRGTGSSKKLASNLTVAEGDASTLAPYGDVSAFNSNGFSLEAGSTDSRQTNASGDAYVAWQWNAGSGSSSSNTNGSITSTVSVNATAGFSIVTYTGTGANATVGHGLGVAPSFVFIKNRSAVFSWQVWSFLTTQSSGSCFTSTTIDIGTNKSGGALQLNSTNAASTYVIDGQVNANGNTYVAYCWSQVAGFSKFGSYTGNGSADGPFVYCGFRPRFVLAKDTTNAGTNWEILDTSRDTYNVEQNYLSPNSSAAEGAAAAWDGLSNGFKLRGSGTPWNASGATIIYAAFAENPFKNSLAR